jgi:hypothetical protein
MARNMQNLSAMRSILVLLLTTGCTARLGGVNVDEQCSDGGCGPQCDMPCGPSCCDPGQICVNDVCRDICSDAQRCGRDLGLCCGATEICYGFACVTPGGACQQQSDCPTHQICAPDLGICIDRDAAKTCEYRPPVAVFDPVVECRWTPLTDGITPARDDVVMAPVVANLTDDNSDGRTNTFDVPDIVFTSYDLESDGCCNQHGTLRIISGACNGDGTMTTHASIADPPIDNSGGLALGDLDGDGIAEIVAITFDGSGHPQGTVAFTRASSDGSSWAVLWLNPTYPTWNVHTRGGAQPALADLDGDGHPEVIVGNVALRGTDGSLLWDGLVTTGGAGGIGNNAFLGPVSSVADIDLDGEPEVLAGNTCYGPTGQPEWTFTFTSENSPCGGGIACDGFTATANFDADAEGEVVIVRLGVVFVLEHDGQLLREIPIPIDDCAYNESGPPTVADFDGDGRPEIGTAAADYYAVVDLDCLATPLPAACAQPGVLWYTPNMDCSSRVTASSVFDFDGDGHAEAIYADETSFRIFDGTTGEALFTDDTHGSHTRLEMVVIADVDNDGNAEVVVAENGSNGGTPGVEVWGDRADNWVFTRRIWNQHSYHVSNVNETGVVPAYETPNWQGGANNFRQNMQGEGLFLAADLVIVDATAVCTDDGQLSVAFDVMNQGSRRVGAGVAVTIYADGIAMATLHTTRPLIPGERESLSETLQLTDLLNRTFDLTLVADDTGAGTGEHNECDEDNTVLIPGLECDYDPMM